MNHLQRCRIRARVNCRNFAAVATHVVYSLMPGRALAVRINWYRTILVHHLWTRKFILLACPKGSGIFRHMKPTKGTITNENLLCYICVSIDATGHLPLQDRANIRALKSKHQSQSNDTAFFGGVFFGAHGAGCTGGRHTKNEKTTIGGLFMFGAPDRIRTCDPCLRRAVLYPTELRAQTVQGA